MLPITLPESDCITLAQDAALGLELEVDLTKEEIRRTGDKAPIGFTTDPFRRHCLLNGLDDIALTMQRGESIEVFEARRSEVWPWLDGFGYTGSGRKIVPVGGSVGVKGKKKMDW